MSTYTARGQGLDVALGAFGTFEAACQAARDWAYLHRDLRASVESDVYGLIWMVTVRPEASDLLRWEI